MAAKRPDRRAFADLVDRYKSLVCSIAFDITRSVLHSEDVAQDVFVYCWSRLSELRNPHLFRAWICRVTRSHSLNFLRQQRLRGPAAAPDTPARKRAPDVSSVASSPLDALISREEEAAVWRALNQLPETFRRALDLYYREGQSIRTVARILDLTEANVANRLSRGRRLLAGRVMALLQAALSGRPRNSFIAGVVAAIGAEGASQLVSAAPPRRGYRQEGQVALAAGLTMSLLAGSPGLASRNAITVRGLSSIPGLASQSHMSSAEGCIRAPPPQFEATVQAGRESSGASASSEGEAAADVMRFDFEDGEPPSDFQEGDIAPGPARAGNRYVIAGRMRVSRVPRYMVELTYLNRTMFRHAHDLVLSFDHWVGRGTTRLDIILQWAPQRGGLDRQYLFVLRNVAPESWNHVSIPFAQFQPTPSGAEWELEAGDSLKAIMVLGGRLGAPLYLDNIRVFHTPHERD